MLADALRRPSAAAQLPLPALINRLAKMEVIDQGMLDTRQATPLEAWCTQHGGWPAPQEVALAQLPMQAHPAGRWVLELQHLRLSPQGIQNLGTEALSLSLQDDARWREVSAPVLAEHGWQALALDGQPGRWQLVPIHAAPDWLTAWDACSGERALGMAVDRWLPRGKASQPGRALLNALQMHWHSHPLNEARRQAGQAELNGAWFWGSPRPDKPTMLPLIDRGLQHHHERGDPAAWTRHWIERPEPEQATALVLLGDARWVQVLDIPAASPWQLTAWLRQRSVRRRGLDSLLSWWHDQADTEPAR
jgi:hypothetical protein